LLFECDLALFIIAYPAFCRTILVIEPAPGDYCLAPLTGYTYITFLPVEPSGFRLGIFYSRPRALLGTCLIDYYFVAMAFGGKSPG
jgi:hypothetical protein